MNIKDFKWTREPDDYTLTDDKIEIITQPGTDLWQRTYYHFRNDNAPVLQIETEEKFFSFIVKTDFKESHHRFDQCGVVMYLDSENWLKGSIEYENDNFQHLGSVVTNNGYSDWATTEIDAEIKSMWYRLSKDKCISCMHCVAVCPKKARNYSKLVSFIAGLKMKKVCSSRKENKLYL